MSVLKSVQAGALLVVAEVIDDYATELYPDPYGGDQREYERDYHLQEHLRGLAKAMNDKARVLQAASEVEDVIG